MQFEMLTRKGTLDGNVRMVVHGKARALGKCRRMKRREAAGVILCFRLTMGIALGQGPAPEFDGASQS